MFNIVLRRHKKAKVYILNQENDYRYNCNKEKIAFADNKSKKQIQKKETLEA